MSPIIRLEPDPGTRSPRDYIQRCVDAGMTRAEAKEHFAEMQAAEWWGNEIYSCLVFRGGARAKRHGFDPSWSVVHISLHRRDRAPVNDWRDLQQIKSAVLGPDAEAIQLYPAESRVVDTSNEYHLWSLFDGEGRPLMWPLGMNSGRVRINDPGVQGAVQRPLNGEARDG